MAQSTRRERWAGLVFRAAAAFLRALPASAAYAAADLAAPPLLAAALWRDRRIAGRGRGLSRNLRIAFRDELTPRTRLRLAARWARHMTWLFVDFCRMPRITRENVSEYVDTADYAALAKLLAEGRGVLCVSGHLGAWELLAHAACAYGLPARIVARPLRPAPLDEAVTAVRRSAGVEIFSKWGVLWPVKKALDAGGLVGMLADENTEDSPVFAPFLGTAAATNPAPAFLHRVTGAPIAVVACHRVARERFRFRIARVIRHTPTGDRERDLQEVTRAINDALSEALRAHPEQWLWGSRRWCTRPEGERPGADGLPPRAGA